MKVFFTFAVIALLCLQAQGCARPATKGCTAPDELCEPGTRPKLDAKTCCPVCKVPTQCTLEQIKTCSATTLPACQQDVAPVFDTKTCCYNCRKTRDPETVCKKTPEQIPACEGSQEPQKDTDGCPTCQRGIVCTAVQKDTCAKAMETLAVCADGVQPVRTSDCCLSCKLPAKEVCLNQTKVDACKASMASLRDCAANEVPEFDRSTCCRTCKLPQPSTCTKTDFEACIVNTPVCKVGEEPQRVQGACCPSCKRAERSCTLETVAECKANRPDCATGERPSAVDGECCPSCNYPKPVCAPVCGTGKRCAWQMAKAADGTISKSAVCVTDQKFNVVLKPTDTNTKDKSGATATKEQIQEVLRELIGRACDTEECSDKLRTAIENLIVKSSDATGTDSKRNIDIDVPGYDKATDDKLRDIIKKALANAEGEGYEAADVTKCTETQIQACKGQTYPECQPDERPKIDTISCCPTCMKKQCTDAQLKACATDNTIAECAAGVRPTFNGCCPSCRPVKKTADNQCALKPTEIEKCDAAVKPSRQDNGCPSCIPDKGTVCDAAQIKACATEAKTLQECAAGTTPERTDSCCVTCIVKKSKCTKDKITACKSKEGTLPVCDKETDSVFDKNECCRSCKPKPKTKCATKEEVAECMADIPTCEASDGETPQKVEGSCCPSCKRPERSCTKETVAKCKAGQRECEATERPSFVEGDCCMSCKPAKPVCTTACLSTEICMWKREEAADGSITRTAVCRNKKVVKFKVTAQAAQAKALLSGATEEEITALVQEIVQRYCDKNADLCDKYKMVLQQLKAKMVGDSIDVDVGTETATGRRLLAETGAAAVVSNAMADQEATDGYTVSPTTDAPSAAIATEASPAILALAFSLLALLF